MYYICTHKCGSSSVGRAPAFQAGCREFEPRLPLHQNLKFYLGFFFMYKTYAIYKANFSVNYTIFENFILISTFIK